MRSVLAIRGIYLSKALTKEPVHGGLPAWLVVAVPGFAVSTSAVLQAELVHLVQGVPAHAQNRDVINSAGKRSTAGGDTIRPSRGKQHSSGITRQREARVLCQRGFTYNYANENLLSIQFDFEPKFY